MSVDLIGELPESNGYNAICVFVDRFSKQIHVIPTHTTLTAEGMAKLYRDNVFRLHGLPRKFIHDRGTQFEAKSMKDLYRLLGIEGNPSTAYHPQTDGQTERINQEIEQYLRIFSTTASLIGQNGYPLLSFRTMIRNRVLPNSLPSL